MKKTVYFLIGIMVFLSCEQKQIKTKKVTVVAEKEAINKTLDNWHKDAAKTNFESYFEAMTSTSIFIGTDASENWTIPEFKKFSKPYFDKGKAWNFTSIDRNIYVYSNGEIAWFDELLNTQMGVCRGSGVLHKKKSGWKIAHYVLSLTIPNDNIEKVIQLNKERDSIFLAAYKKE